MAHRLFANKISFSHLFSVFLIFSLWIGVFAVADITKAEAQDLLVKTADKPGVYLLKNNKKYPIRSEAIFLGYGYRWQDITVISKQTLASYPLMRLVKTKNDPRIYYLDHRLNKKHWQATGEIFQRYGNRFEDVIVIGEHDLAQWNDLLLVKTATNPHIYFLDGSSKRYIPSAQDFLSLGFKWSDVATLADFDLAFYERGTDLVGASDVPPVIPPPTPPPSGEKDDVLKVTTSPNTPKAQTFITFTRKNTSLLFRLTSGSKPISVSSIQLHQLGAPLGNESYLFLQDSKTKQMLSDAIDLSSQDVRVSLGKDELVLTPYLVRDIDVVLALGPLREASVLHGMSIVEVKATSPITMNEPVKGAFHTIISDSKISTVVGIDVIPPAQPQPDLAIGERARTITQFSLKMNQGDEDVIVQALSLVNQGTASLSGLANLVLVSRNRVSVPATRLSDRKIFFDLLGKNVIVPKGGLLDMSLRGDILSEMGRTVNFVVEKPLDLALITKQTGRELLATVVWRYDSKYPIGDAVDTPWNMLNIGFGGILPSVSPNSPTGPLLAGARSAVLGKILIESKRPEMSLTGFELQILDPQGRGLDELVKAVSGQNVLSEFQPIDVLNRYGAIHLKNPLVIAQNGRAEFDILVSIPQSLQWNNYFKLSLRNFIFQDKATGTSITLNTPVVFLDRYVSSVTLQIKTEAVLVQHRVSGKPLQPVGSFTLQNGQEENINVQEIILKPGVGSAPISWGDGFVEIMVTGARAPLRLENVQQPYRLPVTLALSKGQSRRVDISMTTLSVVDDRSVGFEIVDVIAQGAVSKASVQVSGKGSQTGFTTFHTVRLEVSPDPDLSSEQLVPQNGQAVIGGFIFYNPSIEDVRVTGVLLAEIADSSGLSYTRGYQNLYLRDRRSRARLGANVLQPLPYEAGNAVGGFTIRKGERVPVDVVVTIQGNTPVSDTMHVYLRGFQVTSSPSAVPAVLNAERVVSLPVSVRR